MSEINPDSTSSLSAWVNTLKNFSANEQNALSDNKIHQLSLAKIEQTSRTFAKDHSPEVKEMAALIKGIAQAAKQKNYAGINKITQFFMALFNLLQGKGFKTTEDRLLDLAQTLEEQPEKPVIAPTRTDPTDLRPCGIYSYEKGKTRTRDLIPTTKQILGKGSRGKVYPHRDDSSRVIKKTRENLIAEFKLGRQLNHPCIAKSEKLFIKSYGHRLGPKFKMSMERIEGVSIQAHEKLSSQQIAALLQEAQQTMTYLFNQRVYWGDMSENNIFITRDGHLKVCDLGYWRQEKDTSLLTKNLLLGAMELTHCIIEASKNLENLSKKDKAELLARILKPQEFFGVRIPPQTKILSLGAISNIYHNEPWMKSLMAKISKMQPDQQLQFLQQYIDVVVKKINQFSHPGGIQT